MTNKTNKTNKKEVAIPTREEAIARIMQIMDEISAEAERRGLRGCLKSVVSCHAEERYRRYPEG